MSCALPFVVWHDLGPSRTCSLAHTWLQERTLLMWAAKAGSVEIMQMLLSRGAGAKEEDSMGRTAMQVCAQLQTHDGSVMPYLSLPDAIDAFIQLLAVAYWCTAVCNQ